MGGTYIENETGSDPDTSNDTKLPHLKRMRRVAIALGIVFLFIASIKIASIIYA